MTCFLSLDLSKRSTGWAVWAEGSDAPRYGHWVLGSEFTSNGGTFCKLHQNLADLHALTKFEHIAFEDPIHPAQLHGGTNIDTLRVLSGLAAHAESFGEAYRMRSVSRINVSTWRKDFIGRQSRKLRSKDLKDLTEERCRQFGWKPRRNDEADALGILDYSISVRGICPPWRADQVLRPMLTGSVG
jgi:hypothetical protein